MTEVPQTTPPQFNWAGFIGGLLIAIFGGGVANIITGLMASGTPNQFFGFVVGALAGLLLIVIGLLARRGLPGLAAGLLCGGCVIGLIGGICGASMVHMSFH